MLFLKLIILMAYMPLTYPIRNNQHNRHNISQSYTVLSYNINRPKTTQVLFKIGRCINSISEVYTTATNYLKRLFGNTDVYVKLVNEDPQASPCIQIFGHFWYDPSKELNKTFNEHNYSLCVFNTLGDGNCLFRAISKVLNVINSKNTIKFPSPSYNASPELKDLMVKTITNRYTASGLKKLASLDFIGVDFNDESSLYQFDPELLITKLELYKHSYTGDGQDNVAVDNILRKLKVNPYDKEAYKQLHDQLSKFRQPLHWGNEADIAALERIFDIKFIICDQTGSIFTIPSDLKNPKYIAFLHFSYRHYSTAGIFFHGSNDKEILDSRSLYFTPANLPGFLKRYVT